MILQKNKTTLANTDTRLGPNVFFKDNLNRKIATDELGGGFALQTFLNIWKRSREVLQPKRFKT